MNHWKIRRGGMVLLTVLLAMCLAANFAVSQEAKPERKERDDRKAMRDRMQNPRTQAAMEQMRARMMERFREMLGFSEEEWELVMPYVEKVSELNRQLNSRRGRAGAFGRQRGGRGPQDNPLPVAAENEDPMRLATENLRGVLEDEQAPASEIKAALDDYREVRTLIQSELAVAQQELKELLTVKQEAQMVMLGLLQ